jgi:hypothetical protein
VRFAVLATAVTSLLTKDRKSRWMAPAMGKFDRRNSQKMKRRKGQAKKKARLKRVRTASAKSTTAPKKAAAKKSAPPKSQKAAATES